MCFVPFIFFIDPGIIPSHNKVQKHEDLNDEEKA